MISKNYTLRENNDLLLSNSHSQNKAPLFATGLKLHINNDGLLFNKSAIPPKTSFGTRFEVNSRSQFDYSASEVNELCKWHSELTQYETMLANIKKTETNAVFGKESAAVETWFEDLNETEQTMILYKLLTKIDSSSQLKFLSKVINKSKAPLSDLAKARDMTNSIENLRTPNLVPADIENKHDKSHIAKPISRPTSINVKSSPTLQVPRANWTLDSSSFGAYENETTRSSNLWKSSVDNFSQNLNLNSRPTSAKFIDPTWGTPVSPFVMKQNFAASATVPLTSKNEKNSSKSATPELTSFNTDSYAAKAGLNCSNSEKITKPQFGSLLQPKSSVKQTNSSDKPNNQPESTGSGNSLTCNHIPVDFEILENVGVWMKSLRLHKYTHVFGSMQWRQIIKLDDNQLTQMGVNTLGARRKMLRVFDSVKQEATVKNIGL